MVRTGDHTLIGQIAALTGGESGNKSPLGTEMYAKISRLFFFFAFFSNNSVCQLALRRHGLHHRRHFRDRLLRSRYHHSLQGQRCGDGHIRCLDSGRVCARGFTVCCYASVSFHS